MMISISPSSFNGIISPNPSKSIMQRAIAIAAISHNVTTLYNWDKSNDSSNALKIIEDIGCNIEKSQEYLRIFPNYDLKHTIWNVGESGLSTRIFSILAGLFDKTITIYGVHSLLKRPMNSLIETLTKLGLNVEHNNYHLPIEISGKITNHNIDLNLQSGSQVLTGLLIAMSKSEKDTEINVENLTSKPYIDLTINILNQFGIKIENNNYQNFYIQGGQKIGDSDIFIEGDWSGAAFHLVGAAISGTVTINNLNSNSSQADRAILNVLESVGADIKITEKSITVSKNKLNPFVFDATDCPDLFPPLAVLAANCTDTCKIKGVGRLTHKESDRFKTIQEEFAKCGITIHKKDDYMIIEPGNIKSAETYSYGDHRIAMALATLGLNANGDISIKDFDCVSKSYPNYFDDYSKLGGITNLKNL
ncbi:MAG: 3-phosphoshikimate 1-carboxyvinyltransferase [Saprospiraceae bacterium]